MGPFRPFHDHAFILTCGDRFTRWPPTIPIPCAMSEEVAKAFLARLVSIFGCPVVVTTDRCSHFIGTFSNMIKPLGFKHIKTTACHPLSNGLVERFHQQIKAALRAVPNPLWSEILPLVLLGVPNSVVDEMRTTLNELVFGLTLRLAGELVSSSKPTQFNCGDYAKHLTQHIRTFPANSPRDQRNSGYISSALITLTHVFCAC